MAADSRDIITLSESLDAIARASDSPSADDTTRLETWITAVSRHLDWLCGPVVAYSVNSESHDGGSYLIALNQAPVSNVDACWVYSNTTLTTLTSESNTTKSADDFLVNTDLGILYRRSSNSDKRWESGRRNVIVTYQTGRYASTATVDRRFKEAAKIILRHMFTLDHGSGSELFAEGLPTGFAVPARALELVARDRRHPNLLVG